MTREEIQRGRGLDLPFVFIYCRDGPVEDGARERG